MLNRYLSPVAASIALLLPAVAAHAGTVDLISTTVAPVVGDAVSFDLMTSDDFGLISGFQGDLTYDTDVLSFLGVSYSDIFDIQPESTPMQQPGASGVTTLELFVAAAFQNAPMMGAQVLATFNFTAVGAADASQISFGPNNGLFVTGEGLNPVFTETVDTIFAVGEAGVTPPVAAVPLPAGGLLLLTGLFGITALRHRRKA